MTALLATSFTVQGCETCHAILIAGRLTVELFDADDGARICDADVSTQRNGGSVKALKVDDSDGGCVYELSVGAGLEVTIEHDQYNTLVTNVVGEERDCPGQWQDRRRAYNLRRR